MVKSIKFATIFLLLNTAFIYASALNNTTYPVAGVDVSQCPITQSDLGSDVLHVCDCATGADSSCVEGNDSNLGTATSPKKSLTAVLNAVNSGQDVAMCRGGVWDKTINFKPNLDNCSANDPCTIQDYGDSSLNKPMIRDVDADETAFNLDAGSDDIVWSGFRVINLHLKKEQANNSGTGLFISRNISDVLVKCNEIEGYGIGVYVAPNGLDTSNIKLEDSYIHDNGGMGWLGGAKYGSSIERNIFENNGFFQPSAFYHNIYLSDNTEDFIIRGNYLTKSSVDDNDSCLGVSLNVHSGTTKNLLIENNIIEEPNAGGGCWGIMVDGVGNGERHDNAIIRNNVIKNVGNTVLGVSSCIDCILENNIIIQEKPMYTTAIASPNRPTGSPDADVTGTVVRNNTIYFSAGVTGEGIYVGEKGTNYKVTNNIVYMEDSSSYPASACFRFDLPESDYDLVSSNSCYGANFDTGTTGMDSNASTTDPLFVNAPENLNLSDSSPALNSGTNFSFASEDILGQTRDVTPDRGAYESSNATQTTAPIINSVTTSGELKEGIDINFTTDYQLSDGRTLDTISYDYEWTGNWSSLSSHTYTEAGTQTVRVRVMDSSGEYSIFSITLTIAELPFSEMSDEQKLVEAIDPNYYDEVLAIINRQKSDALAEGKEYVQNNLSEFGLVEVESMSPDVSEIVALSSGWSLISTRSNIQDLSIFNSANLIWIYSNGQWKGWSSNSLILDEIEKDSSIDTITGIPANSGIWVLK
jgi:hypothetical protein